MNTLSCIIVDDEPLAIDLLERYVGRTPFLDLKGSFSSAIEAMQTIHSEHIDLIFLDIQMPELNGLELSKTLKKDIKVIFTTAFSKYAIEGYKVSALDYLLKPFSYEEFLRAANKALEWFQDMEEKHQASSGVERDYIFVKSEYKQIKIQLNDILYFEGLKDYIKIWVKGNPKAILTMTSLKSLEAELPKDKFMRVHRSFIIALDKIQSIERSQVVINNNRITIAQAYKEEFQKFLSSKSVN